MNERDKELMIGVLSQQQKVDFTVLAKALNPDLEPDQIPRATVESLRLRWKGLQSRLGIAPPPPTSPKGNQTKRNGAGRGAARRKDRKRKADIDYEGNPSEDSRSSPSKKKGEGQTKALIVKLETNDKEDKAFEDAIFSMDVSDCEV
ncbi:hypothetical protein DID88_008155 [Monilinia fructigena]|uniref:Uncharacterized protein n=1 Tax=Monilinia fructigena TaxID=38457 RepID=A0A395J4J6_9HELO|nr:hypothetical protein DID88_008155 [Monilinia fructigena]